MFETDTAIWFPPDFDFGSWFVQIYLAGEPVLVAGEPDAGGVITLQVKDEHVYLDATKARELAKALIFAADNASGYRGESVGHDTDSLPSKGAFDQKLDDDIPF